METQKTFKIVTNGFTGASLNWWKKVGHGCEAVHNMMAVHTGKVMHGVYKVTLKVMDEESSLVFLRDSLEHNSLLHHCSGITYRYTTPECDVDHWLDTLPDCTHLTATIKKITNEVPLADHDQIDV